MQPAQILVVPDFRNFSIVDQDRAIGSTAQSAELWCIDQKAAEAERAGIALHKARLLSNHFRQARRNTAIQSTFRVKDRTIDFAFPARTRPCDIGTKKDSGSARQGETANTRNVQPPESP